MRERRGDYLGKTVQVRIPFFFSSRLLDFDSFGAALWKYHAQFCLWY